MAIALVLFALLFTASLIRRGRRVEDFPEFPYYRSSDEANSRHLYGRHTANHLYPDHQHESPATSDYGHKAS